MWKRKSEADNIARSALLEETNSLRLERSFIFFCILVFANFLAWSFATELDEVSISTGSVIPIKRIPVVQHLEGGRVAELLVSEGVRVQAGHRLVRFDAVELEARLRVAKVQLVHAKAAKVNLREEYLSRKDLADEGLYPKIELIPHRRRMIENEGRIKELAQEVRRIEEKLKALVVKAPVDGWVFNLKPSLPGEIVKSGDVIMEIVPRGEAMVAEVMIKTSEIGHIRRGQEVTLKFDSYDYSRFGGLEGVLKSISPLTVKSEGGEAVYKGIVSIPRGYIGESPGELEIIPGMTLTADIKTGSKSIIEYLLKPIFANAQSALRER